VTVGLAVAAGVLGLVVGHLVNRAAGRFPWTTPCGILDRLRPGAPAARVPLVEFATALLFVLVVLRFGASWEVPAFLWFAGSAVLLTVIDLQHRLLPNRVVLPAATVGAVLLLGAALPGQDWTPLLRAGLGAVVLFLVFLFLALISPKGLGMGDVKLAGLLGLYLGWIGWEALALGAAAGFIGQAVLALVLLAGRRIGLRGELPFGPAMLAGAALAIGWSGALPG
jgi:leader peptidase (prepilin peptidase)/N-methyltransferase